MPPIIRILIYLPLCCFWLGAAASAQQPEPDRGVMTAERLGRIAAVIDPHAVRLGKGWRMRVGGHITLLTVDAAAGRMRAMVPIRGAPDLGAAELERMLQANFDSALDSRYAIARGIVWAVFVHPMRGLDKGRVITGLAQVATLADTYGTLYSAGALQFGGGDSPGLQRGRLRDLLEQMLKHDEDI